MPSTHLDMRLRWFLQPSWRQHRHCPCRRTCRLTFPFRGPVAADTCHAACTQVHDHLVNTASKSEHGRGGMAAKISAAWMAAQHGCTTVILNGKKPDSILQARWPEGR